MDPKRLREATRPQHEATEASMPLMEPDLSRDMYVHVLACLYPLIAGWDKWAEANAPIRFSAMVAERRRGGLLEQDLRYFGSNASSLSSDADSVFNAGRIPGLVNDGDSDSKDTRSLTASFLGAMYVLEGSTLGGQFIAAHVEQRFGLTPGEGSAYFRGYGPNTGAMWKKFQAELASLPDEAADDAIEAAKAMFGVFADALCERPAALRAN